MNPDTCGRGDSIRIRICVDAETFKSGKKSLRIQKYPDTWGRGLSYFRQKTRVNELKMLTLIFRFLLSRKRRKTFYETSMIRCSKFPHVIRLDDSLTDINTVQFTRTIVYDNLK